MQVAQEPGSAQPENLMLRIFRKLRLNVRSTSAPADSAARNLQPLLHVHTSSGSHGRSRRNWRIAGAWTLGMAAARAASLGHRAGARCRPARELDCGPCSRHPGRLAIVLIPLLPVPTAAPSVKQRRQSAFGDGTRQPPAEAPPVHLTAQQPRFLASCQLACLRRHRRVPS